MRLEITNLKAKLQESTKAAKEEAKALSKAAATATSKAQATASELEKVRQEGQTTSLQHEVNQLKEQLKNKDKDKKKGRGGRARHEPEEMSSNSSQSESETAPSRKRAKKRPPQESEDNMEFMIQRHLAAALAKMIPPPATPAVSSNPYSFGLVDAGTSHRYSSVPPTHGQQAMPPMPPTPPMSMAHSWAAPHGYPPDNRGPPTRSDWPQEYARHGGHMYQAAPEPRPSTTSSISHGTGVQAEVGAPLVTPAQMTSAPVLSHLDPQELLQRLTEMLKKP